MLFMYRFFLPFCGSGVLGQSGAETASGGLGGAGEGSCFMGWEMLEEKAVWWGSLALGLGDSDTIGVVSGDQGSNWGDSALWGGGVPGSGDGSGEMSERALKEIAPIEVGVFRGESPTRSWSTCAKSCWSCRLRVLKMGFC
jgi:hypothetical protein